MKITIIGAGHIGGALAKGLAASGGVCPSDVTVTARHAGKLAAFRKLGLCASTDNVAAVRDAQLVFLAVKPWQIEEVAAQLKPILDPVRQQLVCVSPAVTPAQLTAWFGETLPISYAIPNTAAEVGASMSYVAPVTASPEELAQVKSVLDLVGKTEVTDRDGMLAGTAAASCGIAYAFRYVSAATEGAERMGLSDARGAVIQTVKGATELLEAKGTDPEAEIDKVTTPGGMTLRGLAAMEHAGFSPAVRAGLAAGTAPKRRLVVKVGSNVLTRPDGSLDTTVVSSLVDQIVGIRRKGWDVVLVSSGAVACGRSLVSENRKLNDVQQRQLYSAVGQVRLMDLYYTLFMDYGINVGQVLTQKKNFTGKREFSNQKGCVEVMLGAGVLPIVNENDTVSVKELMFTDNDELSGLIAEMVGADLLILLSNVDGLWSGAPGEPGSELVRQVRGGVLPEGCIQSSKSTRGRGGMASKCQTAVRCAAAGIRVLIANGRVERILPRLLDDPEHTPHTEFTKE